MVLIRQSHIWQGATHAAPDLEKLTEFEKSSADEPLVGELPSDYFNLFLAPVGDTCSIARVFVVSKSGVRLLEDLEGLMVTIGNSFWGVELIFSVQMAEAHQTTQQTEGVFLPDPSQVLRGQARRDYVAGSEQLGCIQNRTKQGRSYIFSPPRPGQFAPNGQIPQNVLEGELKERLGESHELADLGHVQEIGLSEEDAALARLISMPPLTEEDLAFFQVSNGWDCLACLKS
jgi:hypothetical protein